VFVFNIPGNPVDVPLYACDRCGFASTAFRADAARAHQLDYASCAGTIRIVLDPQARGAQIARSRLDPCGNAGSEVPGRRAVGADEDRDSANELFVAAKRAPRDV
jgi:hypothetical protein